MSDREPVKSYRHGSKDRNVQAAIWKNETADGRTFHNVTFKLQYKDGGQWKDASSYGAGDLYNLIRCATDAVAFLFFELVRDKRDLEKAA